MNKETTEKLIEESKDRAFYEILSWYIDEGDYQPTEEEAKEKVRATLRAAFRFQETEIIEEVLRLIDKIESENKDSTFDEWREYKHIRNRIRDKF